VAILSFNVIINSVSLYNRTWHDNKFANSPPCACSGSSGQKPQYGLMTLAYQRFAAVLLLIYGSPFLSDIYYCLSIFWCADARMLELELNFLLNLTRMERNHRDVSAM
jgi:hypothetical protein